MFLGVGGSGKSSLLDGLMNNPMRVAESTALADTLSIKYHWVEAADAAEDAWKVRTEEDEVKELATFSRKVVEGKDGGSKGAGSYIRNWAKAPAVGVFAVAAGSVAFLHGVISDKQYADKASRIQSDVSKSVFHKAMQQDQQTSTSQNPEVVMHIWDCGGQPVFLDIISAFLTSRTMFLLLFDASADLNSKYQESWRHKGRTIPGRKQNISHIQLMMQWMQLIHASLVTKYKDGLCKSLEAQNERGQQPPKMEASSSQHKKTTLLPPYPKVMMVGTRGDKVQSKEQVLKSLQSACKDASFGDLIMDALIVDNTKAGKRREEDPGYKDIRKQVHKFATSLIVPTPLAWVSFRKVVQKAVSDSPIISYSQVIAIAEICGIPERVVPSVLQFYHQLGVFLHYDKIQSLSKTIIAEPRWLIQQLRKLLMPDWDNARPQYTARFWKWLEERGVLLEELYQEIWGDCELEGGAQALADLLEHFDLAHKIGQSPIEMQHYKGNKYFVPCMLKARPDSPDREEEKMKGQPQDAIRQATTLHITFDTGYVPPGFFVRLAVRMTNSKYCTPILDRGVYRNSITFRYNEIDRVTIAESSSLLSIEVDIFRVSTRTYLTNHFSEACLSLHSELVTMGKEVLCWFPSIKLNFCFKCNCPSRAAEHFVYLDTDKHQESRLFCKEFDKEYKITSDVKCWLPPPKPKHSDLYVKNDSLTENEIKNVAREIEKDVDDFAREIEMEYSLEDAKEDRNRSRSLAYAMISDFAEREHGTRYKLAEFLRSARFVDTSRKLLKGELQVLSPTYHSSIAVEASDQPALYAHGQPLPMQPPQPHSRPIPPVRAGPNSLPPSTQRKSLERDLQTRVRENADLQQQLSRKEAKLTRAEETIGREQQQIQELREQEQSSRREIDDLEWRLVCSEALVADFQKSLRQRDSELEAVRAKIPSAALPSPQPRTLATRDTSHPTQLVQSGQPRPRPRPIPSVRADPNYLPLFTKRQSRQPSPRPTPPMRTDPNSLPPFTQRQAPTDQPTMPLLRNFPLRYGGDENLNIIREIGTAYQALGQLLLDDDHGTTTDAIEKEFQKKALDINNEILKRWVRGGGKSPVNWETLVKVLRQVELKVLAQKIETSLL